MKLKFIYSILFGFISTYALSQDQKASFKISPFILTTASIKDGQLEVGAELIQIKKEEASYKESESEKELLGLKIKPSIRLPLTDKSNNNIQIDRNTNTWRGVVLFQFTFDSTKENGPFNRHSVSTQFEYGSSGFKYYPSGNKKIEMKDTKSSFGAEVKYIGYLTQGNLGTKIISPQFRIRYSYDWKSAKEIGILNIPNENGLSTVSNMIIDPPSVKPTLSPAFAFQYYNGRTNFSYAPAIYYDMTGDKDEHNPFGNLSRLRIEFWTFYYPFVDKIPNLKIGASPFFSIRTQGTDDLNKIEYGALITIRFSSGMLSFF
ncbi:hypothetical protein [Chryseobacterium mucoviscidosis]|uniref:hypothetical protein n=1 Tax=Chryseobacterium TaxID=59732 RepID=UPI00260033B0|nr:hypothetical protein [uncultured Chryseobacterium sp.]